MKTKDYFSNPFLNRVSHFLVRLIQDYQLSRRLALGLCLAALVSGVATYIVLTGHRVDKTSRVLPFIYLDLTILLLLSVIIARRLVELWEEKKRGSAGSKLHIQIVGLFALVSIIPGIFVTIFAALFFNVGVQAWFGEPVREALTEAAVVTTAYLNEHKKAISHDAQDIVRELGPQVPFLIDDPKEFSKELTKIGERRGLKEILVFSYVNGKTQVIARSYLTFALEFEKVLLDAFEQARSGEVNVQLGESGDRVRALIELDPTTHTYLYIGKMVDQAVLQHVNKTNGAIAEYNRLDSKRSGLQITFILFFSVVSLLLLLAAVWIGLMISNLLVRPITRLIVASEEVSQGNLDVKISTEGSLNNELGNLAHAFNRMITQLGSQRGELIQANFQLDQRRQFIETILARISAGVISLDEKGCVHLSNHRASALLFVDLESHKGMPLETIAPELAILIHESTKDPENHLSQQITIVRKGLTRILQVSIITEKLNSKIRGYIITFDDVSALVFAQRKAAWSDVARRIAHEIKNPLTPIQLSAERLKRRYLKEIQSDPATFQKCIDTIIRQVSVIGTLVSEFSAFARMPNPVMREENLCDLARQSLFLQKQAYPTINFELKIPDQPVILRCDAVQISQVLTNLLQNAINAVTDHSKPDDKLKSFGEEIEKPAIVSLTLDMFDDMIVIKVEDNGAGFPTEGRERLTEPYFTTRAKGTGLGLAIVAKIIEDHRGQLVLGDSSLGGAMVMLEFARPTANEDEM